MVQRYRREDEAAEQDKTGRDGEDERPRRRRGKTSGGESLECVYRASINQLTQGYANIANTRRPDEMIDKHGLFEATCCSSAHTRTHTSCDVYGWQRVERMENVRHSTSSPAESAGFSLTPEIASLRFNLPATRLNECLLLLYKLGGLNNTGQ